jgi:hypothetical protein
LYPATNRVIIQGKTTKRVILGAFLPQIQENLLKSRAYRAFLGAGYSLQGILLKK